MSKLLTFSLVRKLYRIVFGRVPNEQEDWKVYQRVPEMYIDSVWYWRDKLMYGEVELANLKHPFDGKLHRAGTRN